MTFHPQIVDGNTSSKRRHVPFQLKVGVKYFDTVVTTTDSAGTSNWYRREDANSWRSIASQIFEPIAVPPWCKEFSLSTTRKPQHFHYKLLKRQEDLILLRKRRKREWMMKAYHLANGNWVDQQLKSNPGVGHSLNESASFLADHKKPRDNVSNAKDAGYKFSDAKINSSWRYPDSADRSIESYDDSKESEISNDLILTIPQQKIIFPHNAYRSHGGAVLTNTASEKQEFIRERGGVGERRHRRPARERDDVDLVDWRCVSLLCLPYAAI